jgi:hypothetical protein
VYESLMPAKPKESPLPPEVIAAAGAKSAEEFRRLEPAAFTAWKKRRARDRSLLEEWHTEIRELASKTGIQEAEDDEAKKGAAFARALDRIMKTRAITMEGLAAKVRARERDYTDDEGMEVIILKSLVDDIKAMAGEAS